MFKRLTLGISTFFLLSSTASASDFYNARTLASGGVGVAGSTFQNSAYLNPALISNNDQKRFDFNISVGVAGSDEDELFDNAEDLEDELDDIDDSIPSSSEVEDIVDLLEDLDGAEADFEFGSYFQFGIENPYLSIATFINLVSDLYVTTEIDNSDITALNAAADTVVFDSDTVTSEIIATSVGLGEYGVALAKSFDLGATTLSIGASPKLQDVVIYDYRETVDNYDEDDFDDRRNESDDTHLNIDIGAHLSLADSIMLGVVARDLIEEEFDTEEDRELEMETRVTAGIAYQFAGNTIEANLDLDSAKDFSSQLETQILRVGGQLNLFKAVKLRAGYRHDMEDNKEDLFTFGAGFNAGRVLVMDVAALIGEDDNYGGVVQFNFSF